MNDRNDSNYGREIDPNYSPPADSGREDVAREDREAYLAAQQQKSTQPILRKASAIAALGLGGYALGRSIPRDIMIESLHKLGQLGKSTFGEALRLRNEALLEAFDPALAKRYISRSAGAETELSTLIKEELSPFINDLRKSSASAHGQGDMLSRARAELERRFSSTGLQNPKYRGITVGELNAIGNTPDSKFEVISKEAYQRIMDVRRKVDPQGEWFDRLLVDRHLYTSQVGRLDSGIKTSSIKDLRWSSKRNIGEMAHDALGFQIPIVGFRPVELVAPFFRQFGAERPSFVKLGEGQKIASNVTTLDTGLNYLIGGEALNVSAGGVKRIAPGRVFTANKMDSIGKANQARLGLLPNQNLRTPKNKDSFDYFSAKAQDWMGFGTRFREEDQAFTRLTQAAKRAKGIRDGTWKFNTYENIRAGDLPFVDKLRSQMESIAAGEKYNPDLIVKNPYHGTDIKDMSFLQRTSAYMESDMGNLGNPRLGQFSKINSPVPKGKSLGPQRPNLSVFEDNLSTRLFNVGHHMTVRLNSLIGATTGLGFKPSMGNWGFLYNAMKISFLGATVNPFGGYAIDALTYVDYIFKRVTGGFGYAPWDGIAPSDIALGAYKGATLGLAGIKDISGLTTVSKYSEDLLPGTANSPLSGLVRTGVPAYLMGRSGGKAGLLAGIAIGGIAGGGISDFFGSPLLGARSTDTSKDLYDFYTGNKRVPVRNSRWWMMGRTNFQGEGIDRYSPSWVKLASSGWEDSGVLYGSKRQYFKHASSLPTPHNLFGFGGDEDYFAKKHEADRPYQIAPSGADMHSGEILPPYTPGPRDISQQTLSRLGMSVPQYEYPGAKSAESMSYRTKDAVNKITEMAGVYKFIGKTIFGDNSSGPIISSAREITDRHRLYWDKDIGGALGMTELLRRYIIKPDDLNPLAKVNNVANQMPSFMPGRRSMFEEDRNYYMDFTVGDPYTKVKGGDYRLPGAGYEAVNELYSGTKGQYSEVDAFMILADVAPYSEAYKFYKRKVEGMIKSGEVSGNWAQKVESSIAAREEKVKGYAATFMERRFSGNTASIANVNEQTKYNAVERKVGKIYENAVLDILPEIGRTVPFGSFITQKLFQHNTAEQDYYDRQVLGAKNSNWANPYQGFIRPKVATLYNENPLTAGVGGAMIGLSATTPLGMVTSATAGAIGFGAASTFRAVSKGKWERGFKPGFREDEEDQLEYYDKLEYLRYQNGINRAKENHDYGAISELKKAQGKNTMVGLNLMQGARLPFAQGSLPKQERFYYNSFVNANPEDREKILDMVPSYMADIYKANWEPGSVRKNSAAEVREYFSDNPMPDEDWQGWNLGIQKPQIMSKVNDSANNSRAIDLHRQHISTLMMRQSSMFVPDLRIEDSVTNGLSYGNTIEELNKWKDSSLEHIRIAAEAVRGKVKSFTVRPKVERSNDSTTRYNTRIERYR